MDERDFKAMNKDSQTQEQESNKGTDLPLVDKQEKQMAEEIPESFRALFRCLEDGCYEINFYGNDGNDNQEKINGKELLIKWIKDAYYASQSQSSVLPSDEEIDEESSYSYSYEDNRRYAFNAGARWMKSQLKQGYPDCDNVKDK